jgi:hypothetical protein
MTTTTAKMTNRGPKRGRAKAPRIAGAVRRRGKGEEKAPPPQRRKVGPTAGSLVVLRIGKYLHPMNGKTTCQWMVKTR